MLSLQNKQLINSVVFSFILLFGSPLAFAQWTGIASSSNRGGYVVYIDHSLSSTLDGISNIWLLYDFKVIQKAKASSYLSYKIQMEVDCRNNTGRILGFMDFLEPMGSGVPVRKNSSVQNWTPLIPEGKDKILWGAACPSSQRT